MSQFDIPLKTPYNEKKKKKTITALMALPLLDHPDSQINRTLLFCPTIYIFIFFFEEIQSDLFQKSIWNKLINTNTREGSCY